MLSGRSCAGSLPMFRSKYFLALSLALLGAIALGLSSCGGGGGGGGSSGPPFIGAELDSFPPGSEPPGLTRNAFVSVLDGNGNGIAGAAVSMNGVSLTYNTLNEDYEGHVVVAPGGTVSLSVTL